MQSPQEQTALSQDHSTGLDTVELRGSELQADLILGLYTHSMNDWLPVCGTDSPSQVVLDKALCSPMRVPSRPHIQG